MFTVLTQQQFKHIQSVSLTEFILVLEQNTERTVQLVKWKHNLRISKTQKHIGYIYQEPGNRQTDKVQKPADEEILQLKTLD